VVIEWQKEIDAALSPSRMIGTLETPKRRHKRMAAEKMRSSSVPSTTLSSPAYRARVFSLQAAHVASKLPEGMPTEGGRFERIKDLLEWFLSSLYGALDVHFVAQLFPHRGRPNNRDIKERTEKGLCFRRWRKFLSLLLRIFRLHPRAESRVLAEGGTNGNEAN
jgi:hypothetical protein